MDGAKAVSLRVSQEGSLREYGAGKLIEGMLVPIYAIPTTAGTGSEFTAVAVISDREQKVKMVIRGTQFIPKSVVLDPEALASVPPRLSGETGADALTHAVESYISLNSNTISESLALEAIRLIVRHLRKMVANAGLGLIHSLGHPVGTYYHLSHRLS